MTVRHCSCPITQKRRKPIQAMTPDVRYWHKVDVQTALKNVRFERNNGHGADFSVCPLLTHRGRYGLFSAPGGVSKNVL